MASSSNPSPLNFTHDVFVSYMHEDTGNSFTSHLKSAFDREGFNVAMNDTVDKGEEISDTLLSKISESLVYVVVFSKSYASCAQCLDELVKIWESKEENGRRLLPLFLGVEPTHVRNQTGAFGDGFQRLIKEKEETLKSALMKTANLSRWDSMVKCNVPTLLSIVGARRVAVIGFGLLLLTYVGSIFTAIYMPQIFRPSVMIPLHVILALCFLFQAWKLHKSNYSKVLQLEYHLWLSQSKQCKKKEETWKSALTKTASLSGWDSMMKSEAEILDAVVECINKTLEQLPSRTYSDGFVGIYQVEAAESLLQLQSKTNVQFLGIWGMGGIGKTRISKELLGRISSLFDATCYLENVRQKLESMGLQFLSKEIFSQLGIDFKPSLPRYTQRALNGKRVLVILDDVSNSPLLMSFVKNLHYGSGSRIILTCRDKQVLSNYQCEVYEVQKLDSCESLKLFKFHAFKGQFCHELYGALLNKALLYCGGLPLALELLGCNLYNKNFEEWESELAKLGNIPNRKVNDIIKISYKGLDENEKSIFLDVACVFCGWDETAVKRILHAYYPDSGIRWLIDRALITNSNGILRMHDLIQQFGQDMVFSESKEPGNRSRIWRFEDFFHVVARSTGSKKVEVISVDLNEERRKMNMKKFFFEKMTELRVLNLHSIHGHGIIQLPGGLSSLSNKLSYLCWDYCPLTSFPQMFTNKSHLVELRLSDSHLKQLWSEGTELDLPWLEHVDLMRSKDLIKLPDLSKCPNLKTLDVRCCVMLVEIPTSIEHLSKLQTLNMNWCNNLAKLPVLPQSIVSLMFSDTKIEDLPSRIGSSSQLQRESLPASIEHLSCLTELYLTKNKNLKSLPFLPSSLKELIANGCTSLESLPANIKHLSQLRELNLAECKNLKSLPDLPSSIEVLDVNGCTSLTTVGKIFGKYDGRSFSLNINMGGCFNLDQNSRNRYLANGQYILTTSTFFSFNDTRYWALLPGSEVPGWFEYKAEGSSIEVQLLGGLLLKHRNRLAFCILFDDCLNILEESSGSLWLQASCTCTFVTEDAECYFHSLRDLIRIHDTGRKSKHLFLWAKPVEAYFECNLINQEFSSPRVMGSNAKFEFEVHWSNSVGFPRENKCKIIQCGVCPLRNWELVSERDSEMTGAKWWSAHLGLEN